MTFRGFSRFHQIEGCFSARERLLGARLLSSNTSPEDRKALRLKAKEAKVSKVLQTMEKVKEKSLIGFGVAGCVALLFVGGILLKKRLDGSSEYVVFEKAIDVISKDERVVKELGENLYFFGERTTDRAIGRHAGIKHITYVNPATGNKVWKNSVWQICDLIPFFVKAHSNWVQGSERSKNHHWRCCGGDARKAGSHLAFVGMEWIDVAIQKKAWIKTCANQNFPRAEFASSEPKKTEYKEMVLISNHWFSDWSTVDSVEFSKKWKRSQHLKFYLMPQLRQSQKRPTWQLRRECFGFLWSFFCFRILICSFLTRFELARVIGTRALQISHGAKVQVDMAGLSSDAIAIALEELKAGKINMIIRRNLPNNRHECVRVSDLVRKAVFVFVFLFLFFFNESFFSSMQSCWMKALWKCYEESDFMQGESCV